MKALLFFIFVIAGNASSGNKQVYYEPEKVELTGHLDLQTFAGPPNYESIKSGDQKERHFYLSLPNPVDVIFTDKDKASAFNGANFYDVKIFQLVVTKDEHWAILRKSGEGGHVKIKGSLFQRHTGHHHSRVLLFIESIAPLTKSSHR